MMESKKLELFETKRLNTQIYQEFSNNLVTFYSGNSEIKDFLINLSVGYHKSLITKTYLLLDQTLDDSTVVAFDSLSNDKIAKNDRSKEKTREVNLRRV